VAVTSGTLDPNKRGVPLAQAAVIAECGGPSPTVALTLHAGYRDIRASFVECYKTGHAFMDESDCALPGAGLVGLVVPQALLLSRPPEAVTAEDAAYVVSFSDAGYARVPVLDTLALVTQVRVRDEGMRASNPGYAPDDPLGERQNRWRSWLPPLAVYRQPRLDPAEDPDEEPAVKPGLEDLANHIELRNLLCQGDYLVPVVEFADLRAVLVPGRPAAGQAAPLVTNQLEIPAPTYPATVGYLGGSTQFHDCTWRSLSPEDLHRTSSKQYTHHSWVLDPSPMAATASAEVKARLNTPFVAVTAAPPGTACVEILGGGEVCGADELRGLTGADLGPGTAVEVAGDVARLIFRAGTSSGIGFGLAYLAFAEPTGFSKNGLSIIAGVIGLAIYVTAVVLLLKRWRRAVLRERRREERRRQALEEAELLFEREGGRGAQEGLLGFLSSPGLQAQIASENISKILDAAEDRRAQMASENISKIMDATEDRRAAARPAAGPEDAPEGRPDPGSPPAPRVATGEPPGVDPAGPRPPRGASLSRAVSPPGDVEMGGQGPAHAGPAADRRAVPAERLRLAEVYEEITCAVCLSQVGGLFELAQQIADERHRRDRPDAPAGSSPAGASPAGGSPAGGSPRGAPWQPPPLRRSWEEAPAADPAPGPGARAPPEGAAGAGEAAPGEAAPGEAAAGDAEGDFWLPCGHVFHRACITEWVSRVAVCPMCKRDIATELVRRHGYAPSPAEIETIKGTPEGHSVLVSAGVIPGPEGEAPSRGGSARESPRPESPALYPLRAAAMEALGARRGSPPPASPSGVVAAVGEGDGEGAGEGARAAAGGPVGARGGPGGGAGGR